MKLDTTEELAAALAARIDRMMLSAICGGYPPGYDPRTGLYEHSILHLFPRRAVGVINWEATS